MRFHANGPDIPDALLQRCDQGRVVFLCGAGVSFPSGMPDFVGLTRHAIKFFDPPAGSSIVTAFGPRIREDYRPRDEDGPLAPLDQVFHLLNQEYGKQDVSTLVAERLTAEDLTTVSHEHSLIARISSDPEGRPQIVTTNFDRLFDQCPGVSEDKIFEPPAFPDIELGMPIYGITYLHGRLQSPEYPHHDYILSSADFGRAYLAEGWATKFVRALLDQYTVVLVGYQAEDPPVKYLLQGLNHDGLRDTANLYAFDRGQFEDIEVKWRDRGVTPIAYAEHGDLWATLEAWANRADDPRVWRTSIVEMARQGPRGLAPHERGQVAHLVRGTPGARLFALSEPPPPAEWLNVFDASCRAAKASKDYGTEAEAFDPLEVYGLDDDPTRPPEAGRRTGRVHDHLLEWRRGDANPSASHSLAGRQAEGWEDIPSRLFHLLTWSAKQLNSPVFAWWAARQHRLHPRHSNEIERQLRVKDDLHPKARSVWNLILEAQADRRGAAWDDGWFDLADRIKKDGWTNGVLRALDEAMARILASEIPYGVGASKPPEGTWDDVSLGDIGRWEIKFPDRHGQNLDVPDEALPKVCLIAERHLGLAGDLNRDIGTSYFTTPTCYPGREVDGEDRDDEAGYFRWFLSLLNRMADQHPAQLRARVLAWDHHDSFYFRKLKLFALNDSRLFDADTSANTILEFSQADIWDDQVVRELLFLIADRWTEFSSENKIALVERLLAGPEKMDHWADEDYPSIRDEFASRYTRWLELQGCELTESQSSRLAIMIGRIEDWSDGWATSIVVLHGMHVGWVGTDDDPRGLASVPVSEVVERATSENTRDYRAHTDYRPFYGLVTSDPRKALAALSYASRKGEYPQELWRPLIQNWPVEVTPRLNLVFVHRLARLPHGTMRSLSHPLGDWIRERFESEYVNDVESAWLVFDAVVSGLLSDDGSAINSGRGETRVGGEVVDSSRRTYGHAINGPIGRVTEGLLNALNGLKLEENAGIPDDFKARIERLLAAPGEGSDHAVAILVRQLRWLYFLDREWVMERVIPWFAFDHPASEPAWNAFLSAAKFPQVEIGQRLKPLLLEIFPRIYKWDWDRDLAKIAAQMVVELAIYRRDEPDGISINEARNCIRKMSDSNRQDVVFRLGLIGKRDDGGWASHVVPFIETTWPRERKFRTSEMVSSWVNLLDDTGDEFPVVLPSVLRFLVPVEKESHWLYRFTREVGGEVPLTTKHPSAVLDMLDAIVPSDPQTAPYELASILELVEATDPSLARDRRYFRLIDLVERR
ncbi:SIR2 family protein [Shimia sp. W99]